MAAPIVIASGAQFPNLGRLVITEAKQRSFIKSLLEPGDGEAAPRSPGIEITGEQGPGAGASRRNRYLEFKIRNWSRPSPRPIPSGASMEDSAEEIDADVITGKREIFAKSFESTALDMATNDILPGEDPSAKAFDRIGADLVDFVNMTPYDAQFAHAFSPNPANISGLTTPSAMWTALRTTTLSNLATVLDTADIGRITAPLPASYKNVRCGFLSKANKALVPHPSGAWSTENADDYAPTVDNLRAYKHYLIMNNYEEPEFTLFGKKRKGFLNLVDTNFFDELQRDPDFRDLQLQAEVRGDENSVFQGIDQVFRLHGMYFVPWRQSHSDFVNATPLYSRSYGSAGRAIFCGVTLTRACFATSEYKRPVVKPHDKDFPGWKPMWGLWCVIGSKMLTDLLRNPDDASGTTTTRNRISYLVYSAAVGGGM